MDQLAFSITRGPDGSYLLEWTTQGWELDTKSMTLHSLEEVAIRVEELTRKLLS